MIHVCSSCASKSPALTFGGRSVDDYGSARIGIARFNVAQFGADHLAHGRRVRKQPFKVRNCFAFFGEFVFDFLTFERGQPSQLHLQDRVGLRFGQGEPFNERGTCDISRGAFTDQFDHQVQLIERCEQSLQNMSAFAGALQIENAAAAHNFEAMIQINAQRLFEAERARFVINQRQHDHAERVLQRRKLEQAGEYVGGLRAAADFDHDPQALPIQFVAQIADPVDPTIADQIGHTLDQAVLVGLIRDLADNDPAFYRVPGFRYALSHGPSVCCVRWRKP